MKPIATVSRVEAPAAEAAVLVENGDGAGDFLILCDHAANHIPRRWGTLGLKAEDLAGHIAWDIGALDIARALARRIDSPLIYPTVSRLVIDCNRPLDAPDAIARRSETTPIPGNADVSPADRRTRIATIHEPYHAAIDSLIDARGRVALVAVHTFTPMFKGEARPWHVGVVCNRDRSLAGRLIAGLKAEPGLVVGANEPYSPADGVYYTLARHGEARGQPCAMIEIRNDQVRTAKARNNWARLLSRILGTASPWDECGRRTAAS